jgi:hypothetical protein
MAGRFRPRRRRLVALSAAAGLVVVGWLATTPWLAARWPRVLAVALFLFVFVVAGVAVIAAVIGTWQQLETDRRQLRLQLEVAGQEQAAERFARALDQLGSEQLDMRLGGIYGRLERIAARASGGGHRDRRRLPVAGGVRDTPRGTPENRAPDPSPGWWASQDRVQVFEILSAYVRTTSHRPPIGPPTPTPSRSARPTSTPP